MLKKQSVFLLSVLFTEAERKAFRLRSDLINSDALNKGPAVCLAHVSQPRADFLGWEDDNQTPCIDGYNISTQGGAVGWDSGQ